MLTSTFLDNLIIIVIFFFICRSQLFPSPDGGVFELVISPVRPEDQGLYKCDITYLEVDDQCAVVQFVNLTTLGMSFVLLSKPVCEWKPMAPIF